MADESDFLAGGLAPLRRRVPGSHECLQNQNNENRDREQRSTTNRLHWLKGSSSSYWLTRIVLLRSVALIYFVAFLVAFNQNKQLIGNNGITPADRYLERIKMQTSERGRRGDLPVDGDARRELLLKEGVTWEDLQYAPTLLWFVDWHSMDQHLDNVALAGLFISGFVLLSGSANMLLMFALWLLYHSLVSVGQRWYSFGWESQLLETGFLAIFLCPLLTLRAVPECSPPSRIVLWAYRWLLFRIMLGAGLIKIRGDQCWRDLTCMDYHYQTQPVPGPLAYYLHQSPPLVHRVETLGNHVVELGLPWLLLIPQRHCLLVAGLVQVAFQVVLILSGNLSFLNWLTIVPALACFDDRSLSWLFSRDTRVSLLRAQERQHRGYGHLGFFVRRVLHLSLGALLVHLSLPVVHNLFSSQQLMNGSFDPLRIVNTYGAFGSVTKTRTEVVLEGTHDRDPAEASWREYSFQCKPGAVSRRPCIITPYHYRLDWLMWFAAFQHYESNNWFLLLTAKLLRNEARASELLHDNPFADSSPPRFIRASHYRYEFTQMGSDEAARGQWWKRRRIGTYMPARSNDSVSFLPPPVASPYHASSNALVATVVSVSILVCRCLF